MIRVFVYLSIGFFLFSNKAWSNNIPQIDQCHAEFKNGILEVFYDLSDDEEIRISVDCKIFDPSDHSLIGIDQIEGDIGPMVLTGANKSIRIRFIEPASLPSTIRIHLSAHDGAPLNIEEILNEISESSLQTHLLSIQGKRHAVNDPVFMEKARNAIKDYTSRRLPSRFLTGSLPNYQVVNIEGNQWGGESPDRIQVIDAHYDTYGISPGADDNGSGVAGVMEAMKVLSPYYSKKTIRYLFFDLEEAGLIGSLFYLNNQKSANDQIENCINFEMIGYYSDQENTQDLPAGFNILFPSQYNQIIANKRKGDFITNTGNTLSKNLVQVFSNAGKNFVPELKIISLEVPGTGTVAPDLRRSDHAMFWDKNIPALMITDGANFRNKNYHTPKDSAQLLNYNFMSQVVRTSVASLIELAGIEHAAAKTLDLRMETSVKEQEIKLPRYQYIQGVLYISSDETTCNCQVRLFDSEGHLLRDDRLKPNEQIQWPLQGPTRIHFLQIQSGHRSHTLKFLNH